MSEHLWILDAGHGGIIDGEYQTAGKRSPVWPDGRQLFEGEFNRDIVDRLAQMLYDNNIDYYVLVDTEEDVPLVKRVRAANKLYKKRKDAILVSIHANAGGGTGWEVYTSPGHTKSDDVATVFYEQAEIVFPEVRFRADYRDDDPDKEAKFYMLTKTHCPAILTENFFMDTLDPDCEMLMSTFDRHRIATAHLNAILKLENKSECIC